MQAWVSRFCVHDWKKAKEHLLQPAEQNCPQPFPFTARARGLHSSPTSYGQYSSSLHNKAGERMQLHSTTKHVVKGSFVFPAPVSEKQEEHILSRSTPSSPSCSPCCTPALEVTESMLSHRNTSNCFSAFCSTYQVPEAANISSGLQQTPVTWVTAEISPGQELSAICRASDHQAALWPMPLSPPRLGDEWVITCELLLVLHFISLKDQGSVRQTHICKTERTAS